MYFFYLLLITTLIDCKASSEANTRYHDTSDLPNWHVVTAPVIDLVDTPHCLYDPTLSSDAINPEHITCVRIGQLLCNMPCIINGLTLVTDNIDSDLSRNLSAPGLDDQTMPNGKQTKESASAQPIRFHLPDIIAKAGLFDESRIAKNKTHDSSLTINQLPPLYSGTLEAVNIAIPYSTGNKMHAIMAGSKNLSPLSYLQKQLKNVVPAACIIALLAPLYTSQGILSTGTWLFCTEEPQLAIVPLNGVAHRKKAKSLTNTQERPISLTHCAPPLTKKIAHEEQSTLHDCHEIRVSEKAHTLHQHCLQSAIPMNYSAAIPQSWHCRFLNSTEGCWNDITTKTPIEYILLGQYHAKRPLHEQLLTQPGLYTDINKRLLTFLQQYLHLQYAGKTTLYVEGGRSATVCSNTKTAWFYQDPYYRASDDRLTNHPEQAQPRPGCDNWGFAWLAARCCGYTLPLIMPTELLRKPVEWDALPLHQAPTENIIPLLIAQECIGFIVKKELLAGQHNDLIIYAQHPRFGCGQVQVTPLFAVVPALAEPGALHAHKGILSINPCPLYKDGAFSQHHTFSTKEWSLFDFSKYLGTMS